MQSRKKPYQIVVFVGVVFGLLLLVVNVISLFCHVCYVWDSGHSLYFGNGVFEYGYGWGWIRLRMFHHAGTPTLGWTIQRPLPSLVGLGPRTPIVHIPFWLVLLADVALTADVYHRKRIFDYEPHRYLLALLAWGSIEMIVVMLLRPGVEGSDFLNLTFAVLTIAVPVAYVRYRENMVVPPGFCRKCRYNLTGNVSGRCPECGTDIDEPAP